MSTSVSSNALNYTEEEYWNMYKERNGIVTEESAEQYALRSSFVAYDALEQIFSSESILECKFCKSKKITYSTAQFRSADEAETILCECTDCKKRFRID